MYKYREQTGGCQRGVGRMGNIGEGEWVIQASSYVMNDSQE